MASLIGTKARRPAPFFRYGLALAVFLLALVVRLGLEGTLPQGFQFITFFPAVLLATFLAGVGPGVATAVLSGLAAWYFLLEPAGSFALDRPNALALAFYAAVAGVDIAIIHAMNTALERLGRERERSAALLETSETMFKELQHRVSNNLQLVSSLLRLQGSSVEDPGARRALEEASGRLALLGRLHRRLYDPAGAPAGFGEHLKELCREVLDASGARGVVCIVDAGAGVALPPERSISVALIALELVSNALEHAFAGREGGTITMDLRPGADGSFLLTVEDDGAGLPRGFDPRTAGGLGLRLVGALARQIGGTFEMSGGRGTVCRLSFPA